MRPASREDKYTWSRKRLHIVMPGLTWTGSARQMQVKATTPWGSVLHPDGSYELAAVRPLAQGASGFWTSPVTHKTYPTRWRIDIPALSSRLSVVITGPRGQEYPDGHVEGTAAVTGACKGTNVTGTTFVEMTGDWSRRP